MEAVKLALERDDRVLYALVFGSRARGEAGAESDLDLGVELASDVRLSARELGELVSGLEEAAGCAIDLVLLEQAPPAVAYRVFRDGRVLFERDHSALVGRKTRAILDYLDFRPLEDIAVRRVLGAASDGR